MIILPLALLVLVFALGSTWLHQRAMREMVGERDELAVRAAAGALTTEVRHRISAMRGLALRASDSDDLDPESLTSYEFLGADFDRGLALFFPAGTGWPDHPARNWTGKPCPPSLSLQLFSGSSTASGEILEWTVDGTPTVFVGAADPDGGLVAVGGISAEALAATSSPTCCRASEKRGFSSSTKST